MYWKPEKQVDASQILVLPELRLVVGWPNRYEPYWRLYLGACWLCWCVGVEIEFRRRSP